jgi:hypothetical protein
MSVAANVMTLIGCFKTRCHSTVVCDANAKQQDRRARSLVQDPRECHLIPACFTVEDCNGMLRESRSTIFSMKLSHALTRWATIFSSTRQAGCRWVSDDVLPPTHHPSFAATRWRKAIVYRSKTRGA